VIFTKTGSGTTRISPGRVDFYMFAFVNCTSGFDRTAVAGRASSFSFIKVILTLFFEDIKYRRGGPRGKIFGYKFLRANFQKRKTDKKRFACGWWVQL
jgi:hypothetical protein